MSDTSSVMFFCEGVRSSCSNTGKHTHTTHNTQLISVFIFCPLKAAGHWFKENDGELKHILLKKGKGHGKENVKKIIYKNETLYYCSAERMQKKAET